MLALTRSALLIVAAAGTLVAASQPADAQGGYRKTTFDDLGIEMPVPRNYKAVPVEPTEKWIALKWVDEKTNARARDDYEGAHASFFPELMVVWVDHITIAATTPSGEIVPGPDDEDDDEADEDAPKPIRDFESYMESVWTRNGKPTYSVPSPVQLDDADGNDVYFYDLAPRQGFPPAWATVFRNPRRSLIFFGRAGDDDWKDQRKIWEKMTKDIEIFPPRAPDMSKWERFYEKKPQYVDPEYRLKVRSSLVRGWEADDTDNYIFVYSTKDEPLLRLLKRELEAMRAYYEVLFPPAAPVTAVSTVRICRDRDEYIQYGGSPWSGGYWNWVAQELVFYDYSEDESKRGEGKANSRIVLYHEAFHQYIFYSVGEVSPHSWYNEGTGDFFSGAKISGKKVTKVGVNPWRINLIKDAVERGRQVPFPEILAFEQPEFYRPDRRSVCYAQAWSMIYFLRTSKVVEKHEQWSQILHVYFEALKAAYAEEVAAILADKLADLEDDEDADEADDGAGGEGDDEAPQIELSYAEKAEAGRASREAALEIALEGIDVFALEREWEQFVRDLKPPR